MTRAQRLLERKEALGTKKASYSRLAALLGGRYSRETIRLVLTESESGIPMDRERIMDEVEEALDELEAGEENDEPASTAYAA